MTSPRAGCRRRAPGRRPSGRCVCRTHHSLSSPKERPMSPSSDHTGFHRFLPSGLTGLAGLACAACCAIPLLLAAGVLGGAGWVVAGRWMPGMAILLVVLAAAAWWQAGRCLVAGRPPPAYRRMCRREHPLPPADPLTCLTRDARCRDDAADLPAGDPPADDPAAGVQAGRFCLTGSQRLATIPNCSQVTLARAPGELPVSGFPSGGLSTQRRTQSRMGVGCFGFEARSRGCLDRWSGDFGRSCGQAPG